MVDGIQRERAEAIDRLADNAVELAEANFAFDRRITKAASSFSSTDYMAITPQWALYKSTERGFDPEEQRFRKNKAGVLVPNDYKPSGSGCG